MDILIIKTKYLWELNMKYYNSALNTEVRTKQALTHFDAFSPIMISTGLIIDTYLWTHWSLMEELCWIMLDVGFLVQIMAIISSIDIKYNL